MTLKIAVAKQVSPVAACGAEWAYLKESYVFRVKAKA